jgi:hypothetical protein
VRDRFGRVAISKVGKRCLVNNSNGEVTITDAGGPVDVTSSFGAVEVRNVAGDLRRQRQRPGDGARDQGRGGSRVALRPDRRVRHHGRCDGRERQRLHHLADVDGSADVRGLRARSA